jgi:hypothetical protein
VLIITKGVESKFNAFFDFGNPSLIRFLSSPNHLEHVFFQNNTMRPIIYTLLFTVFACSAYAQSPCDSLHVLSLNYDPMHPDSVHVIVKNESSIIFGYPSFAILNANEDTMALESVAYFGIGNYPQSHIMKVEQPFIGNQINGGKLILMGGFGDTAACIFDEQIILCTDSCSPMRVSVQASSELDSTKTVHIYISDSNNQAVYTTTFVLDTIYDIEDDTVCLSPGKYRYIIEEASPNNNEVYFGLNSFYNTTGINGNTANTTQSIYEFTIWEKCMNPDTLIDPLSVEVLENKKQNSLLVQQQAHQLLVRSKLNEVLSHVKVFDLNGRILIDETVNSNQYSFTTRGVSHGIYIMKVQIKDQWLVQKIIL